MIRKPAAKISIDFENRRLYIMILYSENKNSRDSFNIKRFMLNESLEFLFSEYSIIIYSLLFSKSILIFAAGFLITYIRHFD